MLLLKSYKGGGGVRDKQKVNKGVPFNVRGVEIRTIYKYQISRASAKHAVSVRLA